MPFKRPYDALTIGGHCKKDLTFSLVKTLRMMPVIVACLFFLIPSTAAADLQRQTLSLDKRGTEKSCEQLMAPITRKIAALASSRIVSQEYEQNGSNCSVKFSYQSKVKIITRKTSKTFEMWGSLETCRRWLQNEVHFFEQRFPSGIVFQSCQVVQDTSIGDRTVKGYLVTADSEEAIQFDRWIFNAGEDISRDEIESLLSDLKAVTNMPARFSLLKNRSLTVEFFSPPELTLVAHQVRSVLPEIPYFPLNYCRQELPFLVSHVEKYQLRGVYNFGCKAEDFSVHGFRWKPIIVLMRDTQVNWESRGFVRFPETYSSYESCANNRYSVLRNYEQDVVESDGAACLPLLEGNRANGDYGIYLFGKRKND